MTTAALATTGTPIAPRWATWMTLWVEATLVFGVAMVAWKGISGELYNWVLFGSTSTPAPFSPEAVDYQRMLFAVLGAVLIGWMVLLLAVVRGPFRRGEAWAWPAVVGSVVGWYVVDSVASVALGYPENAVVNTLMLAAGVPPLVATRPR